MIVELKGSTLELSFVPEKNRLSSSSAMVLAWAAGSIHTSPQSQSYLAMLDLSAGEELLVKCNAIWPHYSENIKNRKHAILRNADRSLSSNTSIRQVIILAAGFDALSLELASRYDDLTVFDTDLENMMHKASLIQAAAPDIANRVLCIEVDLTKPQALLERLAQSGWNHALPSLIIAEGISYYLSESDLKATMHLFQKSGLPNQLILEYLLMPHLVREDRRDIPDMIFATIMAQYAIPSITRYTPEALMESAKSLQYNVDTHHYMKHIEKERTGNNEFFPTDDSGWIAVAHFSVAPLVE